MNGLVGYGRMGQRLASLIPMEAICGRNHSSSLNEWEKVDVLFDFSHANRAQEIIEYVKKDPCTCILGTSNYSEEAMKQFKELSKHSAILYEINFALGIQLMKLFMKKIDEHLTAYDIELIECHHLKKADKPSGTSVMLKELLESKTSNRNHKIEIHALRGGHNASSHEIVLLGDHEKLVLSHTASDLDVFMQGIILAYHFIQKQPPGWYTMEDVLSSLS